jgi:hypothetical protein
MSSGEKVFIYSSSELELLINKALVNALPSIREDIDIKTVGEKVFKDVSSSKIPEERPIDEMTVKELKQWAIDNDITIPERYHSKQSMQSYLKKKKKKIDEEKSETELVWDSKKYYTDKDRFYVYTEEGIAIAKFKPDGGVTTLKEKDEKALKKLKIKYKLLSAGNVTREVKSIRAKRREAENPPSPSRLPPSSPTRLPPSSPTRLPPSPLPSPPSSPTRLPPSPLPSPPSSPTLIPPKRKDPIATIEDVESDLYETSSETEDVGGEGILSDEKEDSGDIISEMEKEFDDLIEKSPPITKKEYTQFMTALIVKQIPLNVPKIAKASDLSEDTTADILMTLTELGKKFPNVEKEIRNQKSRGRLSDPKEKPPLKRRFRK